MSRFTQADAEAAGWAFVHEQEAITEPLGGGRTRLIPGVFRAEKYVKDSLVNEVGETKGQLLDRIEAYETHLNGLPVHPGPAVVAPAHDPNPGEPVVWTPETHPDEPFQPAVSEEE